MDIEEFKMNVRGNLYAFIVIARTVLPKVELKSLIDSALNSSDEFQRRL